ncbi:MAG: lipoprotein signal peptidase [Bacteroidales bacterium]|nr:lipoprotein signal peptidase [Bacteroidales bacterium]
MKLSKGNKLLILGILLVVIDQVIKIVVKSNMYIGQHIYVIGNWFQILFIENEGMAFGMKFGGAVGKFLLSFFRIGLFAALCWWISSLIKKSTVPFGVVVGLTLITAGAFGNIIDSLFYGMIFGYAPFMFGKVVDMFYFPIIDTTCPAWMPFVGGNHFLFFAPVFNFADSCVTVGAFYLIFFQYKFFARGDETEEESK